MGTCSSIHSDLGSDFTSFEAAEAGTRVRWGDSFELSMATGKDNDNSENWAVSYKRGIKKERRCDFSLTSSRDDNGVKNIHLGMRDITVENETSFVLEIERTARYGLRGGIKGLVSNGSPLKTFTRTTENYSIQTTIVSFREGLFVLEMKKIINCHDAYMATLAHYYVTKHRGLSVTATIRRNKDSFGIEVEGPIKHPADDLRKVLVKTCRTGVWSPNACSHCSGEMESTDAKTTNSSLMTRQSEHQILKIYFRGPFYNNHTYTGSKVNSGANSGSRYDRPTYTGNSITNSGTFNGNGNGGNIGGNFDASSWNYQ